MLPSEFFRLPRRERAFLIAAIEVRVENERKKDRELKARRKR